MEIRKTIRMYMKSRHIKMAWVAERLGTTRQHIWNILNSKEDGVGLATNASNPDFKKIREICEVIGLELYAEKQSEKDPDRLMEAGELDTYPANEVKDLLYRLGYELKIRKNSKL